MICTFVICTLILDNILKGIPTIVLYVATIPQGIESNWLSVM